ncbi:MAG: ABC transporter substrate-binding protein [Pseudomonadota bacterium]
MKMKGKVILTVIFTFLCMISITSKGYTSPKGIKRGITDDTIKIGFVNGITGPAADTIVPVVQALRTYTSHINDNNGIHGRKIKLLAEDDRLTIPGAVSAFKKLVYRDEVFALIGFASGQARALKDNFIKEKIPTFAFAGTEEMTRPYIRYIFIPLDPYENQVGIMLDYILETSKKKNPKIVNAVIEQAQNQLDRGFDRWTKHFGINYKTMPLTLNIIDATAEVLTMKRDGVDYIVMTHVIPAVSLMIRDAARFGLNAKVFATNTATSEDVIKLTGPAAKNFYGIHSVSSWYDDAPGIEEMRKITFKYHPGTEKLMRPKTYSIGWVVMKVYCEAIKRAGKDIDNEKFIDAMETINNYDTQGLSGPLNYTSTDHEGVKYDKIYHADPETVKFIPVTDWRKAPALK